MFNFNRPNFAITFMSSTRCITRNGMTFGFNTSYSNINGLERKSTSIFLPEKIENILDNNISNLQRNSEKGIKALDLNHQKKMRRINSEFFDLKKYLTQESENKIEESDNSNIKKEQELEDLKQEEEEIDDSRSVLSIDDTFFRNETEKINERFNKEKKRIDEKHKFKKPKLEIDECDKEKMQNHKKQIKKLKKYSKNLNYDKVIDNFSLKEYV